MAHKFKIEYQGANASRFRIVASDGKASEWTHISLVAGLEWQGERYIAGSSYVSGLLCERVVRVEFQCTEVMPMQG